MTGRADGAIAGGIFALTLAVYAATAARSVTWEHSGADGGDLLTAAAGWGVPHPTGYPTYILLLRVFSWIVPAGEIAFRASLMSALLGGAAVALLYLILIRIIRGLPEADRLPPAVLRGAALTGAIAFAFSRQFWSQANIPEVYALNAAFFALLLLLLLKSKSRRQEGRPDTVLRVLIGLVIGIGLGNHLTLGLAVLPFVVWSLWTPRGREGRWRLWLDWRPIVGLCAGLAVYAYPPIASARGPVINWGHPDTWEGFRWMISGSIYQSYAFGVAASHLPTRLASWADFFMAQFTAIGLVLGAVGITVLWERHRGLLLAGAASVLLVSVYTIGYQTRDSFIYLILPFMVFTVWIGAGLVSLLTTVQGVLAGRPGKRPWTAPATYVGIILVVLLAVPGFSALANAGEMDLSRDTEARDFAADAVATAGPGSVVLASTDEHLFSLWYRSLVLEPEADVLVVSITHLQYDWYWEDLRRHAPGRVPEMPRTGYGAALLAMVRHNLGTVPVYVTFLHELYDAKYTLVPDGDLFRFKP